MMPYQTDKIYPCPFSKGYGIPSDQAWSLLKIFFIYRLILSSLFLILYYGHLKPADLNVHDLQLYRYTSQVYSFLTIISGICVLWRVISYTAQAQLVIFSDIIFIVLIMHACGGISSGVGILLAVSIAAGGLLIGGRCALLFAALASLAMLTEQIYTFQTHPEVKISFTYTGMLGASFLTIAYLSYVLAKRNEQSDCLALLHQQKILNLEELNQYIIQHLQSGIIITNLHRQIKMCNQTTLNIINARYQPSLLDDISCQLVEYFNIWIGDPSQNFAILQLPNHNEIYVRLSLLETRQETLYMIIFEDISLYNQQLQQSKLASLGRLTASIAHEIRNPLSAISHAAQLLSETPDLSPQDLRLAEIIQSHSQRVNKIIEDILQLSRRNVSKREKIHLNHWIPYYLQGFIRDMGCAKNRFIVSEIYQNIWIYIDPEHLKQILDNLCSNALKYGEPEREITVEISLSDNFPCLKIHNYGKKIDDETVNHLFEPFFTTSSTGTGLGLYISKELAELNQAKLRYVGTDNKNSFWLCLPHPDSSKIEI